MLPVLPIYSLRLFSREECNRVDSNNFTNRHVGVFSLIEENVYAIAFEDSSFNEIHQKLQIYPADPKKTMYSLEPNEIMEIWCVNDCKTASFCGKTQHNDIYLYFSPTSAQCTIYVLIYTTDSAETVLTRFREITSAGPEK
jgi:hypothetical protein